MTARAAGTPTRLICSNPLLYGRAPPSLEVPMVKLWMRCLIIEVGPRRCRWKRDGRAPVDMMLEDAGAISERRPTLLKGLTHAFHAGPFELGGKDELPRPRRVEVQGSSGPSFDPYNTGLHLQGAPQRLLAKRAHLRALSGASPC